MLLTDILRNETAVISEMVFRYKIERLSLSDKYVVDMSVAVCLEPHSCELDIPVLNQVMIPIIECNLTMPARATGTLYVKSIYIFKPIAFFVLTPF